MRIYEVHRKQDMDAEEFPLLSYNAKVSIALDFGDLVVPPQAERRIALDVLRRFVADVEARDLAPLSHHLDPTHAAENGARDDGGRPVVDLGHWQKPADLDLRVVKSAHRIIREVAQRGQNGKSVLASELVGSIGLSAPTVGRLLRDGEPGASYLRRYVVVTPKGRTKALDLTPEGRRLASKIRAGVVPA